MKHTAEQLVSLAHDYYPQDAERTGAEREKGPEAQRRVEAHARACGSFGAWVAMLGRLAEKFPEHRIENRSIFRQSPGTSVYDLGYSGSFGMPARGPDESYRYIGFIASIVVPYYAIYDLARLASGDDYWRISFDFSEQDRLFVREIGSELESTFSGYSQLPEAVGKTIVPGVRTSVRRPGEATVYDCLFSDDW